MPPNNTRPRSPMAAYRARKDKGSPSSALKLADADSRTSQSHWQIHHHRVHQQWDLWTSVQSQITISVVPHRESKVDRRRDGREFAIKKFKPDKEGEAIAHYSGISQSAVREMAVYPGTYNSWQVVVSWGWSYQRDPIRGSHTRREVYIHGLRICWAWPSCPFTCSFSWYLEYYPLPCAYTSDDTHTSVHSSINTVPTRPCVDVYASSNLSYIHC